MSRKLGDICRLVGGYAYSSSDFLAAGVPVVKIGDVTGGGYISYASMQCIPEKIAEATKRFRTESNDTLIAMTGANVGKTSRVGPDDPDARLNQRVGRFVPIPGLGYSKDFIHYLVSSLNSYSYFANAAYGSAQPNISANLIEKLPVPEFNHTEANRIGSILVALDDKIELNRRMNETLEATARAIFKDWFVDFGPTRAKIQGHAPYLAADVWSLFPGDLAKDGNPSGWVIGALGEVVAEMRRGISPTYLETGGVRVLNQKCIRDRQVNFKPSRRHDSHKRSVQGRTIAAGDILVNSTGVGTLGRVAQVWEIDEPSIVDGHVTVVRCDVSKVSPVYLGLNLTGRESEIEALGEGSTGQTELSRSRLAAFPLLLPTREIQNKFELATKPLIQRMTANLLESRTLAATRDLLLPKLMSGEIRIKDAEKIAGEAA